MTDIWNRPSIIQSFCRQVAGLVAATRHTFPKTPAWCDVSQRLAPTGGALRSGLRNEFIETSRVRVALDLLVPYLVLKLFKPLRQFRYFLPGKLRNRLFNFFDAHALILTSRRGTDKQIARTPFDVRAFLAIEYSIARDAIT